ncbi:MAG: sensor histidine kinase [Lachnospiraceae bacterium]|nr:sensor histidine kinase [Lachnospiraceae bacterium]
MRVKMGKKKNTRVSLPMVTTLLVIGMVLITLIGALFVFMSVYRDSVTQNAVTNSEQAVTQVYNTVSNYTEDMDEIMIKIQESYQKPTAERADFLDALMHVRSDVVSITTYSQTGRLQECWANDYTLKDRPVENLSYIKDLVHSGERYYISEPHVETLLVNYYPWVVTMARQIERSDGSDIWVAMDIRFSEIANYVDNVGIGQHGYCFIVDEDGSIIYHPQQQLIFSGLKKEDTSSIAKLEDGTITDGNVIYSIKTLNNSAWRVVGISFVDEMITSKIDEVLRSLAILLFMVLIVAVFSSLILSYAISSPIHKLVLAMGEFEQNAIEFSHQSIHGTAEIHALSDSFGHMVVQIQGLMEQVKEEQVSLRKTELKALQAQINPHFLYNTLDAIGWLCEEERNRDAVEMVNALAKLFRISISKGHELITIEQELQHAESYLKIEKFRYKNQFVYSFDVDNTCLPYLCNKITLQPIIENAIYHGLNRMVDEGEIKIVIKEDGDDVVFSVEDNGIGMTQEQCEELLGKEAKDRTGIGIKNVNDRIKIYFGEKYGLQITSELDEGTKVTIRMPKIKEGTYETK